MPEAFSPTQFWQEAEALGRAAQVALEYFEAMGLDAIHLDIAPPAPPRPHAKPQAATQLSRAIPPKRPTAPAPVELPTLGRGSSTPLLVVVASAPAVFEGEQHALLTAMIEKGLRLSPDEFYVTSLLRTPLPPDADFPDRAATAALGPLRQELLALSPPIVLALGQKAGGLLAGHPREHLLMLRKQTHTIDGLAKTWLRVSYALDDLLTTPELKKEAWNDLKKIIPVIQKLRAMPQ